MPRSPGGSSPIGTTFASPIITAAVEQMKIVSYLR